MTRSREAHGTADAHHAHLGRSVVHPSCPKCGGPMWDNRADKRNPKAPDFRCRRRECEGRLWPGQVKTDTASKAAVEHDTHAMPTAWDPSHLGERGPLADSVDAVMQAAGASDVRVRARAELRARYLDVTDFVLTAVRPKYAAAGTPIRDTTVAAIVAALFTAMCNRDAIGDGSEATNVAKREE